MKNKITYIFVILFWLITSTCLAQDTLWVMVREKEVIEFDNSTMHMVNIFDHTPEFEIRVEDNEVLYLHLFDNKKRFRDVVLKFDDGVMTKDAFKSKDKVVWTKEDWPAFVVTVSKARFKR